LNKEPQDQYKKSFTLEMTSDGKATVKDSSGKQLYP